MTGICISAGVIFLAIPCLLAVNHVIKKKKARVNQSNIIGRIRINREQSVNILQTNTQNRLLMVPSLVRQISKSESLYSFDTALNNSSLIVQEVLSKQTDNSQLPSYDEYLKKI